MKKENQHQPRVTDITKNHNTLLSHKTHNITLRKTHQVFHVPLISHHTRTKPANTTFTILSPYGLII